MPVTLTDAEARAIRRALDNYLPELEYELARIDRKRDQHEFAEFERILRTLRTRLEHEPASAPTP